MSVPGPIRLEVPDLVDAVPGGPFEFEVRLTHLGSHDTSVLVRVVGALVGLEPARIVDLPAGAPVTTTVRMALPDGMSPGRHLVVVEVVERTVGQVVEAAEVAVAIARTRGVTITMTPAMVSKRRGGKFTAMIRNHDDVEQKLKLKPVADRPGMALVVGTEEVVLAPGESLTVTGRLKMKGFWLGQLRERWFTLLGDSSGASVYGRGLVMQKPIIGRSVTRLVGLVAVLAVWLTGTLVVMRLLDPVTDDAATEAGAAVDEGPAKPTIPFGDGETKATITVSGAVTAQPDGSGVTVLYRPVTLADTDLSEGKATPVAEETEVAGLRTETNIDGEFEVAGLNATGIFEFRFAKPGHNTLTRLVQPNGADAVVEVALEVGSGVISGTILGPMGGPRGGVLVTLSDGAITYTTSTPSSGDNVGQFTFNNLSTPGTYVLDARATGFGLASTVIELDSGGVRQDVVLEISPDIGVMSGRVSSIAFESLASTNRLPVKGVMITATDGTVTRTTSTLSEGDLAGTFRLVGLPLNRTYTVTYEGAGWSTRTELVDFGLDFEPLDVSLVPSTGRVRGTVTTPPDTVLPSAVAITLASPDNTYKSTDAISADGDLLLTGILPGTYVAVFQSIGLADQVRDVTVSAGQTSLLDVDMRAPVDGLGKGTIQVTLIDTASLEPLDATATMRFRSTACGTVTGSASGVCTWSVSRGALTITDLDAGAYTVGFTAMGYRPDLATVDVTPGQTIPIEMGLAPLGSVQGLVTDADGGALQGVNLTLYEALPDDSPGEQVAATQVNDKGEYRFRRVMFSRNYVLSATLSGYSSITRPITGAVASTVNLDIILRSESQIAGQLQTLDLVTGSTDPVSLDKFTVFLKTGYDSTTSAWVDLLPRGLVRTLGGYRFGVTPNKKEGVTTSASAKYAVCIQRNEQGVFDPAFCDTGPPEFVQRFDNNGQGIEIEQGELRVLSATFTPFPASVSGVVRLPNGASVPEGLTVELRRVDFDNKVLDTFTTTTDTNGRFGFENMAPTTQVNGFKPPTPQPLSDGTATATGSASSWRIQVRSESGSYNGVRFDLGPNAKYDMDVRMQEGTGRLEFFMMDDLGDPIRNAVVYVMRTTTGAQNVTYDDFRYGNVTTVGGPGSRCGSLPAPADIALANGVPLSGCTDASGSIKFDIVSAPVQYYVAIGMAAPGLDGTGAYAELLKQVIPVRVNIDATESRSLRQTWYYGDTNILVSASDTDRVPTATLAAPGPNQVTISYQLIATTGATPVPEDDSIPCFRENVYTWLGQSGTVGLTPNGECFINDMRPGTYRVTAVVNDPALRSILQTTTSAVAVVQPGRQKAVVPITIPVIQRELQVRVVDGATNATVSGATVVVKAPTATVSAATKSTGADGTVTFSSTSNEMPAEPGIVLVTVGFPGFSTTSATVNVRTGEQQTLTIALSTSVAEARVAVVDTTGEPVTGATVTIDGLAITEASCVVPQEGWYCLRAAPSGITTVVVSKAGYRTMTVPMAIANPGGGTVTVVLGATTGRLFLDAVDAATGLEVNLGAGSVSIVDQGGLTYNTTTKTFTGVTPGVVRITVAAQGPYAATTVSATVLAGVTTSATVRLNRVSEGLVVTLVDSLGNPVSGASVSAGSSGFLQPCVGGVTNRYCWLSATPGVVSVSASKPGYTTVLLYTMVNGDGTGSIALVVRQLTGNLLVNVVDGATGQPISVVSSQVTVGANSAPCTTAGLQTGRCRFDGLDSGGYTVVVSGVAGYQAATLSALVPLDGQTGTVNVMLQPVAGVLLVDAIDAGTGTGVSLVGWSVTLVDQSVLSGDTTIRTFSDVAPGVVRVAVVPPIGSVYASTTVSASVSRGTTTSATVRLNRSSDGLVVTVVDSLGATVSGATVTAEGSGSLSLCDPADPAFANRFCLAGVPSGVVSVTASAPGFTTVTVLTTVNDGGSGSVTLVVRQLTGKLLVNVVDAVTGQSVAVSASQVTVVNSAATCTVAGLATGQCRFDGVDSGPVTVAVSGVSGYGAATASASVPLDGQTGTVNVALRPANAELVVRVVDQQGSPVPSPTLVVSVGTTGVAMIACGDAFCGQAPAGLASVTASATNFTTVQVLGRVTTEGGAVTVVLRSTTGNLLVSLVNDATGLPIDFSASLSTVTLGASAPSCTVYDTGRCLFSDVDSGVVTVAVTGLTGYTDATASASVLVGDQTTAVTLRLRAPAASTGDVVLVISDTTTGQPITSGLSVVATNSALAAPPAVTTTDAALGRYALAGYSTGLWTVTVSASGYLTRVITVRVAAGSNSDVAIDLSSNAFALVGSVSSAVGGTATSALAAATITLTDGNTTQSTVTDAIGRYVFATVTAGAWTVSVDSGWAAANGYDLNGASSASVTIVSGAATLTQNLVVDTKPGGIDVTVRAATGALASDVTVWVDVNRNGVRDGGEVVASDANGAASVSAIPAGVYQIELSDPSQRYATTSALVMVERDRTSNLTFRLASWGVNVNVAVEAVPVPGLSGQPVSVWVRLVGASSTLSAVSTTSNGALALATFQSVPADTYTIELSADGTTFVGAGGTVTLAGVPYVVPDLQPVVVGVNGFDIDAGVIRLERATVDVTISVRDRNNAAVNGAQISITGDTLLSQRTAFTTTSGQAIVRLPAEAVYDVSAALSNYGATQAALNVTSVASSLTLVLNPDNAVLDVVAVEAASPSTSIVLGTYNVTVTAASDPLTASGTYGTSQTHYPGDYRVRVSVPGYIDFVTTISLVPGERRTVTAPLTAIGASSASVTVSAINAANPSAAVMPTAVQLTRLSTGDVLTPDGNSAFHDLVPGAYRVSVSATGFTDYVSSFSVVAGEQLTVTARMSSNAVGGVVVSLRSTFGATIAASPGGIALVNSAGDAMPACTVDASDNSRCTFSNVPAGPYSVTVSASGYSGFDSISVVTGTTTNATVMVNFTATATFTVTGSGQSVPGATVSIDGTGLSCVTNGVGECSISGLDPAASLSATVTAGSARKDNEPLTGWPTGTRSFTIEVL